MTNDKDKRIKRLEEKVEKLENAVRMPTRREAIAAGGIGLAGLAGFSSGASAASPSDAVGPVYFDQIGDSDNPVSEFYVDQEYQAASDQNPVFDSVTADQASINGPLDAESATLETLVGDYHYAGGYDGADPETRLDNAVSAASVGDTIYLENAEYPTDRTVTKPLVLIGSNGADNAGTDITGDWTLDARAMTLRNVLNRASGNDGEITVSGIEITLSDIWCATSSTTGHIRVTADWCRIYNIMGRGSNLVFESDTNGGIVDTAVGLSITDNGTNTVGDIS